MLDLFIYTSQFVKFFLSPLNHIYILFIFVLAWQSRWRGKYWALLGKIASFWLVLLFSPLFSIGLYYFERIVPVPPIEFISGKSALVLSGGTGLYHRPTHQMRWFENAARVQEPLRLYKQGLFSRLIFTGGQVFALSSDYLSEASSMGLWWEEMGVAGNDILLEDRARNTYENFKLSLALFKERDFVLVTSALHLPRAMMVAHKMRLDKIVAYPVDYKVYGLSGISWWGWKNVENAHRLIFEVVGMLAYLLTGQGS